MDFEYNPDLLKRDSLIYQRGVPNSAYGRYLGGTEHVQLSLTQLEALIDAQFLRLERSHNESPSASDFLSLLRKIPRLLALAVTYGGASRSVGMFIEGVVLPKGAILTVGELKTVQALGWEQSANEWAISADGSAFRAWWD